MRKASLAPVSAFLAAAAMSVANATAAEQADAGARLNPTGTPAVDGK